MQLLNQIITAAAANQLSQLFQLRGTPGQRLLPANITLLASLVYGSGGTTIDAYAQTSIDGGASWMDVANFHFTTASAKKLFNISSLTPIATEYTPTDGSITADTCKDGLIGPLWRVKYTSVGTYAGNSTLRIDAFANGLVPAS